MAGYLLLRWIFAVQPGYVVDTLAYKRWAMYAARFGLPHVYATSDIDYPPLYAYLLYPLGMIYGWISPEALAQHADSGILTLLIKLPPLLFDLALAAFLYYTAKRVAGSWGRPDGQRWGTIAAALYLLNPAVLFDTAYWGQPDCIHSFFILAAFCALFHRPVWVAWALLTLGLLMKPLAAPYFPLLLILTWVRFGLSGVVRGGLSALALLVLAFTPFAVAGELSGTLDRVFGDVMLMAHTSTNAHNFWWVVGAWQDSEAPWVGPLTPTHLAMICFAGFYALLLWKAHRLHARQEGGIREPQVLVLIFAIAFTFFMVATHMHENHMFATIPLALPLLFVPGALGRRAMWIYAGVSLAVFLNLILHDLELTLQPPLSWGGDSGVPVANPAIRRTLSRVEQWSIRFSTLFNIALYALTIVWMFRRRGWLDRLGAIGAGRSASASVEQEPTDPRESVPSIVKTES
jgi:dolichyl-phosphate-mannose-protein mannosyltransferase